jgi:membrane fusion protein, multidrug efflux system
MPHAISRPASRHRLLLHSALLLALATGCKKADATAVPEKAPPVHVDVAEVALLTVPRTLRLTGTLRGAKETDLAANVAGRVLATQVERGQSVKKGELLARVDVLGASLALAEARVQVQTSTTQEQINQQDCARYEQLKADGVVTALEYDQVTARCKTAPLNVQAAKARQSIAAKNVGDGVIRSPFDGVITERYVDVGEYVQASSRVVSLAQVDELRLEFSLPEQNFPDVKVGAEVRFQVSAYRELTFDGKVAYISGAVRSTRDVVVEATVPNPERKLLPGMFADVEVTIGSEPLPTVPKSALFEENGKPNVFVVHDGTLEQRVVQTAPEQQGRVPVRRGVNVGDRVVSAKVDQLENGQAVN